MREDPLQWEVLETEQEAGFLSEGPAGAEAWGLEGIREQDWVLIRNWGESPRVWRMGICIKCNRKTREVLNC